MKNTSKKPKSKDKLKPSDLTEGREDEITNKIASKQTESEMQIPEGIDINLDETPPDKREEVSENTEDGLDENEEDSRSSDFVPFSRTNSRTTANPFLEQSIEPVENLERDLNNIPNRQTENNQMQTFNAPQYSSSAGKSYYEQPTDDTYPEQVRPTRIGRSPIDVSLPFDDLPKTRLLNPNDTTGWRNQEDTGYPGDQKYKFGSETKRRRDDL